MASDRECPCGGLRLSDHGPCLSFGAFPTPVVLTPDGGGYAGRMPCRRVAVAEDDGVCDGCGLGGYDLGGEG